MYYVLFHENKENSTSMR
uniref:Uncharacterized protein n=1 Tax=Anguilla anguilla TaxID=7936 RepID=A0A0E9RPT3_ANGAN